MHRTFNLKSNAKIREISQLTMKNMRENSIIKERILQYIDIKHISKYEFYQKTGVSNGVLSQKNGLSEENLMRFLSYYTDVSAEWITRGEGEMLIQNKENSPVNGENPSESIVKTLLQRNEDLARENGQLQAENAELKKELARAGTSMAASATAAAG